VKYMNTMKNSCGSIAGESSRPGAAALEHVEIVAESSLPTGGSAKVTCTRARDLARRIDGVPQWPIWGRMIGHVDMTMSRMKMKQTTHLRKQRHYLSPNQSFRWRTGINVERDLEQTSPPLET